MGEPLTVAQLLELHPFPEEFAKHKRIERLWVFDLPGTPAALWPFISDTSRMNRALGTAPMTFVEKDGRRHGSSKAGGVQHEWVEVPWNWVAEQWLTSTRIYERGFMKVMYAIHRLEPTATGTRVYLYFGTVPRNALYSAAIRLGFPSLEKAYRKVLPALAAQLDRLRPEILQQAAARARRAVADAARRGARAAARGEAAEGVHRSARRLGPHRRRSGSPSDPDPRARAGLEAARARAVANSAARDTRGSARSVVGHDLPALPRRARRARSVGGADRG